MTRAALALAVAGPLVLSDLVVKTVRSTPPWAYHERSAVWLLLSVGLLAMLAILLLVPSRLVAPAIGILGAGVAGNALSAAWSPGLRVPNPIVLTTPEAVVAFNLADIWVLTGLLVLVPVLARELILRREAIDSAARRRRSSLLGRRRPR